VGALSQVGRLGTESTRNGQSFTEARLSHLRHQLHPLAHDTPRPCNLEPLTVVLQTLSPSWGGGQDNLQIDQLPASRN
jgi:hypothetical protein